MRAICFHGVITETLLSGGGDPRWPARSAGQGYYHHWLWVSTTPWMRVGTPCTFIVQPDVDYSASSKAGEVKHCLRLTALPGHLAGVLPEEEAIAEIVRIHFRDSHQADWLRRLTQAGRVAPQPQLTDRPRVCVCPIQTLMTAGCRCGAVAGEQAATLPQSGTCPPRPAAVVE